jgi:hypothetical protein
VEWERRCHGVELFIEGIGFQSVRRRVVVVDAIDAALGGIMVRNATPRNELDEAEGYRFLCRLVRSGLETSFEFSREPGYHLSRQGPLSPRGLHESRPGASDLHD